MNDKEKLNRAKSLARKQKSTRIQKARNQCQALVLKQQPGHVVEYALVLYSCILDSNGHKQVTRVKVDGNGEVSIVLSFSSQVHASFINSVQGSYECIDLIEYKIYR